MTPSVLIYQSIKLWAVRLDLALVEKKIVEEKVVEVIIVVEKIVAVEKYTMAIVEEKDGEIVLVETRLEYLNSE